MQMIEYKTADKLTPGLKWLCKELDTHLRRFGWDIKLCNKQNDFVIA